MRDASAAGAIGASRARSGSDAPLVLHVLYRLDTGGLERVLIDTVRGSPHHRHAVVSLTTASPALRDALPDDVPVVALDKRPGQDPRLWWAMFVLIGRLAPSVVHTYNIAALEFQLVALARGVPRRVHAEHGRSADDPHGTHPRHRWLRRRLRRVVHAWVVVSADLGDWLTGFVGVPAGRVHLVHNGIDVESLAPTARASLPGPVRTLDGFCDPDALVVGTVGRLDPVKNQRALVDSWARVLRARPASAPAAVLAILGGGPLEAELRDAVERAGLAGRVWLPGMRGDVAALLHRFDLFVLPSIAEGVPMTLLEAMACGVPALATRVGGIPEVLVPGTGELVAAGDDEALAAAIARLVDDAGARERLGRAGRARVVEDFGLDAMLDGYRAVYAGAPAGGA